MSNHHGQLKNLPRSLWITLEAEEVIELKRIGMDRDETGAVTFFHKVLMPHVIEAARKRGLALDLLEEIEDDVHLSG